MADWLHIGRIPDDIKDQSRTAELSGTLSAAGNGTTFLVTGPFQVELSCSGEGHMILERLGTDGSFRRLLRDDGTAVLNWQLPSLATNFSHVVSGIHTPYGASMRLRCVSASTSTAISWRVTALPNEAYWPRVK